MLGMEPRVDPLQGQQTAYQQPGGDQEDDAEGGLAPHTMASLRAWPRRPPEARVDCCRTSCRRVRMAVSAGARPKTRPVSVATAAVKASARPSSRALDSQDRS